MRKNEVFKVKWKDILFDYNVIKVTKGKGNKDRFIPLSPQLKESLLNLPVKSEYVFVNERTEKPITDKEKLLRELQSKQE